MSDQEGGLQNHATKRSRKVIGILLLYLPLLALIGSTLSFSEEDAARRFIVQLSKQVPTTPSPMPVLRSTPWPDIAMQRDPFQLATATTQEQSPPTGDKSSGNSPQFLASYRDMDHTYVLVRRRAGNLVRFGIGDDVDGDRIENIDSNRVTLTSHGQQKIVEISAERPPLN
jgi:hypothetical protein